jgi:hypothetical protein
VPPGTEEVVLRRLDLPEEVLGGWATIVACVLWVVAGLAARHLRRAPRE